MTNMIDLDSQRQLSCYSYFETRSLIVLELMESLFGPPPINPVNIKDSFFNENWPRSNIISDVILLSFPPSSRVFCLVLM